MNSYRDFCSFCNKHRDTVQKLICGPWASICNECVILCVDMLPVPVGCATAGEVIAAEQATEAERSRWILSPFGTELGELHAELQAVCKVLGVPFTGSKGVADAVESRIMEDCDG